MNKRFITLGISVGILMMCICGCTQKIPTDKINFIQKEGWLIVNSVKESNISWSDINITLSSGTYSDIGFHSSMEISSLIPYGNGTSCPESWGVITKDNGIYFSLTHAIVVLNWEVTGESLGEWDFS